MVNEFLGSKVVIRPGLHESLGKLPKSDTQLFVCVLWAQLVPTVQLALILASFVVPPGNR